MRNTERKDVNIKWKE